MTLLSRRTFAATVTAAPILQSQQQPRPNVLWVTCEDTGPHLHACGDDYSVTPNLDKLCQRGSIYMNAWSNAPVCAPARTTIISGVYPPATGSEHMRSDTRMPADWKMFPGYLRDAGYYCTNNAKEDYNLAKPPGTWDESSQKAHWRKRAAGQPFFSVFNLLITHESQLRTRPHTWVHDPSKARVPAYHPDTPEVRKDWAQYYDNITTMDGQAGQILADLEKDGLAEDTIIFFYGDHGSGMPRSKRWPYNSGLNVSIVVSIPEKFRHLAPKDYVPGKKNNRLVGFVDLAPTMLSLAGVKAPQFYQGEAFLGPDAAATPRPYNFGFRGRMDERIDCVRSVRNQRYVYTRNYMPHKIYGQHLDYMWDTPTTPVWEKLYKEGKLNAAQSKFWETKPPEELYDLNADRDEVNNLAGSAQHKQILNELRKAHREHTLKICDVGLLPEAELHTRPGNGTPYQTGHDPKFPLKRILDTADMASSMDSALTSRLITAMSDPDSGVRYWGAMGILMRGAKALTLAQDAVVKAVDDSSPSVRVVASEILGRYGTEEQLSRSLKTLMPLANPLTNGLYLAAQALNAIDALGKKAAPLRDQIAALPKPASTESDRVTPIIERLKESILRNV